jgi:hypothetical protein
LPQLSSCGRVCVLAHMNARWPGFAELLSSWLPGWWRLAVLLFKCRGGHGLGSSEAASCGATTLARSNRYRNDRLDMHPKRVAPRLIKRRAAGDARFLQPPTCPNLRPRAAASIRIITRPARPNMCEWYLDEVFHPDPGHATVPLARRRSAWRCARHPRLNPARCAGRTRWVPSFSNQ